VAATAAFVVVDVKKCLRYRRILKPCAQIIKLVVISKM